VVFPLFYRYFIFIICSSLDVVYVINFMFFFTLRFKLHVRVVIYLLKYLLTYELTA